MLNISLPTARDQSCVDKTVIVLQVKADLENVEREDIVKALKDTLLRKNGLIAVPEFVVKRSNYIYVCNLLVVGSLYRIAYVPNQIVSSIINALVCSCIAITW